MKKYLIGKLMSLDKGETICEYLILAESGEFKVSGNTPHETVAKFYEGSSAKRFEDTEASFLEYLAGEKILSGRWGEERDLKINKLVPLQDRERQNLEKALESYQRLMS